MFWRKKKVQKWEDVDIHYTGKLGERFINRVDVNSHDIYLIVKSMEQCSNEQRQIQVKLNLILKELGKEYVPEKSVTEPAKLVNKIDWSQFTVSGSNVDWNIVSAGPTPTKQKKKRGRPKTKK